MKTSYLFRKKNAPWRAYINQPCFSGLPWPSEELVYIAHKRSASSYTYSVRPLEMFGENLPSKFFEEKTFLSVDGISPVYITGERDHKKYLSDEEYVEYLELLHKMGYLFDYQITPDFVFVHANFEQFHKNRTAALIFLSLLRYAEEGIAGIRGILKYTKQGLDAITASGFVHKHGKYGKLRELYYAGSGHSIIASNQAMDGIDNVQSCFFITAKHILKTIADSHTMTMGSADLYVHHTSQTLMWQQRQHKKIVGI